MSFDTHWLRFEITHGPQAPGAKEDALFWYKKGQDDVPDVATQKEDAEHEEEPTPADTYSDGYEDGRDFAVCKSSPTSIPPKTPSPKKTFSNSWRP